MPKMLRRLLRAGLTGVILLSLVWTGWSLWQFSRHPIAGWLVERADDQLGAAYDKAILRHATPARLAGAIQSRLDEVPRNWVAIEGLTTLAEQQDIALPADLLERLAAARQEDFSFTANARACSACALDLRRCTMGADLACGIGVNLTVMGDVLSLGRESGAWLRGDAVDQVDVTLSFVGIGATGLVLATGGSSMAVKLGAGVVKIAHRMGRLTPGMRRIYTRAFQHGVDWRRLSRVRAAQADDLARLSRADAMRPAVQMTEYLGIMQGRLGTRGALHLVAYVDDLADARAMSRAARTLGPRSVGSFELLGKARFLRTGLRLADALWDAVMGMLALVSAGLALVSGRVLRYLRRSFL